MYDQNNENRVGGFDQGSSTYHYSYTPQSNPTPPVSQKPKRKRRGLKVVALVLCCALIGGGAGLGGAAIYGAVTDGPQGGANKEPQQTTIYRNDTDPVSVQVQQADGLKKMELTEIYASYADSCVCITTQSIVQQGRYQYQATGAGSGFILSEDGYIVTNYHVIDGATAIKVTLNNGESYDAKMVGGEEVNDVAVIKIDGISGLKPVVVGDSDDIVVGETVCTIGNALGTLSFSQTSGAVSATDRAVTMSDGTVINMIQTDCTINSGNSGGPLFDSYGRVAGIVSAKYSNNGDSSSASIEGIGFAIPINDVFAIITDYMEYGYVTGRPYMGLTAVDVTQQYMSTFGWPQGAYVNSVETGSCAQKAGLRQGDIITKMGDTEITGVAQMVSVKNGYRAGDTVEITLFRAGEYLTTSMTFDEQVGTQTQPGSGQAPAPQPTQNQGDYSYPFFDPWEFFFGN